MFAPQLPERNENKTRSLVVVAGRSKKRRACDRQQNGVVAGRSRKRRAGGTASRPGSSPAGAKKESTDGSERDGTATGAQLACPAMAKRNRRRSEQKRKYGSERSNALTSILTWLNHAGIEPAASAWEALMLPLHQWSL